MILFYLHINLVNSAPVHFVVKNNGSSLRKINEKIEMT